MNRRAMTKPFSFCAALALSLPVASCGGGTSHDAGPPPLAGAAIGGPFTLINRSGHAVHWSDFKGRYRIVYFGYSFCPDACPTDVAAMMRGFDRFAAVQPRLADQIQPIFITIDPARDTPAVVGQFAAAFSPRLLGLTGSPQQVDGAARAFSAYYARGRQSAGGYLMDHSRIAYLMGRDGDPITMLPVDKGPVAVAAELAKWVH